MRRGLFSALAASYFLASLRSLFVVSKDDSIPLIIELLSARACPSGMLVLLRLAAAGSLAASGLAFGLARSPALPARLAMQGGLVTHGALSLGGARVPWSMSKSLPVLAAAHPPCVLHVAGMFAGIGDFAAAAMDRPPTHAAHDTKPADATTATVTPRAFLLDIDGTLLMTDDIYYEAFKQLLAPLGIAVDPEWYSAHVHGKTDAQVFEELLPGSEPDEVIALSRRKDALFCELYRQRASHSLPLVAGLTEAFEVFKRHGVRCIAVTNAPRGAAEECIDSLRRHLPAAASVLHKQIIIGAECTSPKPDPDPYLTGARVLGMAPQDCIVFEDSRSGVRSGIAAGVHAVVALRTSLDDTTLKAAGASLTLKNWNDLTPELLRQLLGVEAEAPGSGRPVEETLPPSLVGLRQKIGAVALPAIRLPPLGLLFAASAMAVLPGTCVQWGLHCNGGATEHTTGAARAAAAALLAIACAEYLWKTDNMNVHDGLNDADAMHLDTPTQRVLATTVLASSAVCIHALAADGHGLVRGARNILTASTLYSVAATFASAELRRRTADCAL